MSMTPTQRVQLQLALLKAFPSKGELARMVDTQLDEHLDSITTGRDMAEIVAGLVAWAEAQDRIDSLIAGARVANPANQALRAVDAEHALDLSALAAQGTPDIPHYLMAHFLNLLAVVYFRRRRWEQALRYNNRALRWWSDNPTLLMNRAGTYTRMHRYTEALADCNAVLAFDPNNPGLLNNRGVVYYSMERYNDALADWNRSLDWRPNTSSTLLNRALAYARLGQLREGQADIAQVMAESSGQASTLYTVACFHSVCRANAPALAALQEAIEHDEYYRSHAPIDPDFAPLLNDPAFCALVGLPPNPAA